MKKGSIVIIVLSLHSLIAQEYFYYDGTEKKRLYLKKDYIIDFSEEDHFSRQIQNKGTIIKKIGNAKIYQVKDKDMISKIKKGVLSKSQQNTSFKISEVFTTDPNSGTMMALPGRIILSFKDNITKEQIENFLQSRNLQVIRKQMILNKEYYVISAPTGIASLELANELRLQPEIEISRPDFWIEISKR